MKVAAKFILSIFASFDNTELLLHRRIYIMNMGKVLISVVLYGFKNCHRNVPAMPTCACEKVPPLTGTQMKPGQDNIESGVLFPHNWANCNEYCDIQ